MKRHRDRQRDVTVTPPETETETDIKIEPKGSTKKQTRGTRISAEWELPTEWGKWAESEHGLTYQEIVFQADKFKDYWIARADKGACKLDWQATWRNWIRSNIERKL
jgi:hypothetical protein